MSKQIYKEIIDNIKNDTDDFYVKNLLFIGDRKDYFNKIEFLHYENKLTNKEYEKIINCIEEEIGSHLRCELCDMPILDNESYNGYCYDCRENLEDFIVLDEDEND